MEETIKLNYIYEVIIKKMLKGKVLFKLFENG